MFRIALVASLNLSGLHNGAHEPEVDELIPPLGILSLAAIIEQAGHLPTIVDLNYEIVLHKILLDEQFYDSAAVRILVDQPEIVGFSTMCNSFHISLKNRKSS
jgi:hypothetical protein